MPSFSLSNFARYSSQSRIAPKPSPTSKIDVSRLRVGDVLTLESGNQYTVSDKIQLSEKQDYFSVPFIGGVGFWDINGDWYNASFGSQDIMKIVKVNGKYTNIFDIQKLDNSKQKQFFKVD